MRLGRPEWWIAGGIAALLLWVASCALCGEAGDSARGQRPPPASAGGGASPDSDAQIIALRLALDREVEAREQLALEVAALREQLDAKASASGPEAAIAAGAAARAQQSMFDGK